ncbi:MAG: hypothetical protein JST93_23785 [Acidobacteria bacterium]|nr:hypothetical protein [Acidobacteriota bacterium]
MLAKFGRAPSAEEIDENRREMFRNFGQEFQLIDDGRLSFAAAEFIEEAAAAGRRIVVSSDSLAEIVYLIEKNRVAAGTYAEVKTAIADPERLVGLEGLGASVPGW